METLTESGLILKRQSRDQLPNDNPPVGTVGPHSYGGAVMSPELWVGRPAAWQGWPVEWQTPNWNGSGGLYERVGTAMTCSNLNSTQLASFPTYVMRGTQMVDSPSWLTNPEPSLYAEWGEASKQLVNCLQLRGETFLYATGRYTGPNGIGTGPVARWVVANPDQMQVTWEEWLTYRLNGEVLPSRDVLHIKLQSYPGNLRGIGALEWVTANVVGTAALEAYMAGLATRGGVPWAVIKHPMKLNETQSADLQNAWVSAASRRNGAPAVLSGGIDLEVLTLSPRDMALLDLQVWNAQRIASAFGVPPYLIGLPMSEGGPTYANAQNLFDYHWRSCLRPLAQTIANALSAWALPAGQRLEFNPDRYVQAEPVVRAQAYQLLFNIFDPVTGERAITIPEIRALERLMPLPADEATSTAMELNTV